MSAATIRSPAREFARRFRAKPVPLVAGLVIVAIALAAILAPWIAPFDPAAPDYDHVLEAPSWLHWCGTDAYGRDILSRIIWGGRLRSPPHPITRWSIGGGSSSSRPAYRRLRWSTTSRR